MKQSPSVIRKVTKDDYDWLYAVFLKQTGLGDANSFRVEWWRTWNSPGHKTRWHADADRTGFIAFNIRKDGVRNVIYIAVDPDKQQRGTGRQLIDSIGLPVICKTGTENDGANAFYRRLGFLHISTHKKVHHDSTVNVWYRG